MREQTLGELLAAIGARTPAPASGSAAALTAALAAALAELAARFADDQEAIDRSHALGARLVELAEEDARVYSAFMTAQTDQTRAAIVRVPEEIAAAAAEVAEIADRVHDQLRSSVAGDAEAASALAQAAGGVAKRLADFNV